MVQVLLREGRGTCSSAAERLPSCRGFTCTRGLHQWPHLHQGPHLHQCCILQDGMAWLHHDLLQLQQQLNACSTVHMQQAQCGMQALPSEPLPMPCGAFHTASRCGTFCLDVSGVHSARTCQRWLDCCWCLPAQVAASPCRCSIAHVQQLMQTWATIAWANPSCWACRMPDASMHQGCAHHTICRKACMQHTCQLILLVPPAEAAASWCCCTADYAQQLMHNTGPGNKDTGMEIY